MSHMFMNDMYRKNVKAGVYATGSLSGVQAPDIPNYIPGKSQVPKEVDEYRSQCIPSKYSS